ncbi:hypothetical protein TSAR_000443 [Trichomalopsis sarcophagae]|uniref:Uncharacterized protein n=1 Tax=Trichomalopsis sarcophagae TaxID=543379 RepID=A0A232EF31_9HYME|nr:hypothetical protein TSAR_000443 [Trichomalopsis sarcophagae]
MKRADNFTFRMVFSVVIPNVISRSCDQFSTIHQGNSSGKALINKIVDSKVVGYRARSHMVTLDLTLNSGSYYV